MDLNATGAGGGGGAQGSGVVGLQPPTQPTTRAPKNLPICPVVLEDGNKYFIWIPKPWFLEWLRLDVT